MLNFITGTLFHRHLVSEAVRMPLLLRDLSCCLFKAKTIPEAVVFDSAGSRKFEGSHFMRCFIPQCSVSVACPSVEHMSGFPFQREGMMNSMSLWKLKRKTVRRKGLKITFICVGQDN